MAFQRVTSASAGWSIDFVDCEPVVEGLLRICRGWNLSVTSDRSLEGCPAARVTKCDGGWRWQQKGAPKPRDWDRLPPKSSMRVLTDVQDAALHWYLDDNRRFIGLHAGAARIGSTLACFPARGFAGKSTLMACLARRGHKVFGDDVVLISGRGRKAASLGFTPRLRTPFATCHSQSMQRFFRDRAGPASNGWAYMELPDANCAHLGESCDVGSIVLLQRQPNGRARLEPATRLDCLKALLAEHLPGRQPMRRAFETMHSMSSQANLYQLTFSRTEDAARLLERELA